MNRIPEEDLKVGMHCEVTAMGSSLFVITEIIPGAFMPIGIGLTMDKTIMHVRPISILQFHPEGSTNN